MTEIIDRKYVALLAPRLERFKNTGSQWNFRCPVCGDSQKNKAKARAYFFSKGGKIIFYCHNCHASMPLGILLKKHFPDIHHEYLMDVFGSDKKPKPKATSVGMKDIFTKPVFDIPTIDSLPATHPAKEYIRERQIPSKHYRNLYYTDDFSALVDTFIPNHNKKLVAKDARVIIPFKNEENEVVGFQGRTLDPNNKLRYITIKKNDEVDKLFGLERIDWAKNVYVVEGPFDSLFIDNCIATMDSNLMNVIKYRKNTKYIYVNDNEPRNKDICREYTREIEAGASLVIWDDSIVEKDINDMVIAGLDVMSIIQRRTFTGLQANLEYGEWKKI